MARILRYLLRFTLSAAILWLAFRSVNPGEIPPLLRRLDGVAPLSAAALLTASMILSSWRWRLITESMAAKRLPLFTFVRANYRGAILNQGLPTTFGGDALRVIDSARAAGGRRPALAGVIVDRLLGLTGLFLINLLTLPLAAPIFPPLWTVMTGLVSAVGTGLLLVSPRLPWDALLGKIGRWRPLLEIAGHCRQAMSSPRQLFRLLLITLVSHACYVGAVYCLARRLGVGADYWTHLVIQPTVLIVSLMPVSLAGWGVREGSMTALFAAIGEPTAAVMATSLSFGVVFLLAMLPGLVFLLIDSRHDLIRRSDGIAGAAARPPLSPDTGPAAPDQTGRRADR